MYFRTIWYRRIWPFVWILSPTDDNYSYIWYILILEQLEYAFNEEVSHFIPKILIILLTTWPAFFLILWSLYISCDKQEDSTQKKCDQKINNLTFKLDIWRGHKHALLLKVFNWNFSNCILLINQLTAGNVQMTNSYIL